jgi:hypothetical protein
MIVAAFFKIHLAPSNKNFALPTRGRAWRLRMLRICICL